MGWRVRAAGVRGGALLLAACVLLAGCLATAPAGPSARQTPATPAVIPGSQSARVTDPRVDPARSFAEVVDHLSPVIRALCLREARDRGCDFRILVDTRPGLPPNAFQSLDEAGRPVITFTATLIAEARNADELAFVLGHEAAHHIAGHIPRARQTALAGALIAGTLAALGGADPGTIRSAQNVGAAVGARTYSKDFELEADRLGTVIAWRAGFNAERGAAFFGRLPDPGNRFLGSHPPNAARVEAVRQTLRRLGAV